MGLAMAKGVGGITMLLLFSFTTLFGSGDINVRINSWDGYQYYGTINNKPVVIYLEVIKKKEKEWSKDKEGEEGSETEVEFDSHYEKPGKIKIVFRDSKDKGTTLVYERDMEDGEISETDRKYIERVLESIEKFHKENRSLNGKLRDGLKDLMQNVRKRR